MFKRLRDYKLLINAKGLVDVISAKPFYSLVRVVGDKIIAVRQNFQVFLPNKKHQLTLTKNFLHLLT